MNSIGFEKVEFNFNFNCDSDLDEEDVSKESDPLALVHDYSYISNDDSDNNSKNVKMVISSVSASLPVKVNTTQNLANKSNIECERQGVKRIASTPPVSSSPRKRLVTVIPKPRPQFHNLAKIQPQTDATTNNATRATTMTTAITPIPTMVKKNPSTSPSSSTSSNAPTTTAITTNKSKNSILLQSKLSSEPQSNTSHAKKILVAVKSPLHTINNGSSIVKTDESGIQMPIITSVTSLQQPTVEKVERQLVQPKIMMTTNAAVSLPQSAATRLRLVRPYQVNNFVSSPRISITSLLAAAKKVPETAPLPPFRLAPTVRGRPPGPGPSSLLPKNNGLPARPLTHNEKINRANNNYVSTMTIKNNNNNNNNSNNNSETCNSWKYFKCMHCDKKFWQEILLTEHLKRHNPNKPYKCTECDRSYLSNNLLLLHLESHTGIKEFECHLCSQTFRRQGSLNLHLKGHEGIFPFACAICDKSFMRSGSLRIHQLNTHQVVLPLNAEMDAEEDKDSA